MMTLITPRTYCDRVGISMSKAAHDRMTGDGANFCKIGRRVMYPEKSVEEFLQARLRKSTSDSGK
jgi:hypothetical protein